MTTFECPEFVSLPDDLIDDFNGCFQDNVNDIQECITTLESVSDEDGIHQLFRHMHSLKGNCKMVNLDQASDLVHALEDFVTDIRDGQYGYTTEVGDLIMAGIAQIEQMILALRQNGVGDGDLYQWLMGLIKGARCTDDAERAQKLDAALVALGGSAPDVEEPTETAVEQPVSSATDLQYFRSVGLQLDQLSIFWKERTKETTQLAEALNQSLGGVVESQQLEAAICIHDLGMALIPHSIFNKQTDFNRSELRIINGHVEAGAEMLARIPGWQQASDFVRQHHERYDGSGYPQGLKGEAISAGARIISIVDTFFAVTHERPDRSYRRSVLSAISEINGSVGTQFDPDYVEAFNQVIREQLVSKSR